MHKANTTFEEALERYKHGESASAIILSYPKEDQDDIAGYLGIARIASRLAKRPVPVAQMRHAYLGQQPNHASIFNFMDSIKMLAFSFGLIMLAFLGIFTAFAAKSSLPGDKLFSLKKAYQSARIQLAGDQQTKVEMQLSLASERVNEVQQVLAKNDPQAKNIAINELKSTTTQALNNIKQIALDPKAANKNLVQSAESLAATQTKIIAQVDPNAASQSANDSNKTVQDIINLVAAANSQGAAEIITQPNIVYTGKITAIKQGSITVDRNEFIINANQVKITDKDANNLSFAALGIGDTVKVEAKDQNNSNMLNTLTLINKAKIETKIKPTNTTQTEQISTNKDSNTTANPNPFTPGSTDLNNNLQIPQNLSVPEKPKDIHSGFIVQ